MVVPAVTLICLSLATLLVAAAPVLLYRYLRRPFVFDWRDTVTGVAVFALFAMVIERALNAYVLRQNGMTAGWLAHPAAFVAYGSLAAGLCEEVGRFIALRLLLGRRRTRQEPVREGTGLAYGIGHGGAEAWLVGVLVQVQWIFFAVLANRGQLDAHLGQLPAETAFRLHVLLASLSPALAGLFVLERAAALVFQIGLSVLMWHGLRAGWRAVLPLAIVAHAVIDVPAAMSQARLLPLLTVDAIYVLAALCVTAALVNLYRQRARPA